MDEAQTNTETPVVSPEKTVADKIYPEKTEVTPSVKETPKEEAKANPDESSTEKPESKAEDLKEVVLPKDSLLGKNDLDAVLAYAKENGLTNKQAQALIEKQSEQLEAFMQNQVEAFKAKVEGFENAIKSDKEIGGANFEKSVTLASRVLQKFGTNELKQELDLSGYGSHPEVVRLLARIGSSIGDDSLILPNAKPTRQMSAAEKLYGSSKN